MTVEATTTETVAPVANLAAARKEQAAAKKTTTPAKKTPAKKAATAATAGAAKLRWTGDTAVANGVTYELVKSSDGKWSSTMKKAGKTTTLADGVGRTAAYQAVVRIFKGA